MPFWQIMPIRITLNPEVSATQSAAVSPLQCSDWLRTNTKNLNFSFAKEKRFESEKIMNFNKPRLFRTQIIPNETIQSLRAKRRLYETTRNLTRRPWFLYFRQTCTYVSNRNTPWILTVHSNSKIIMKIIGIRATAWKHGKKNKVKFSKSRR